MQAFLDDFRRCAPRRPKRAGRRDRKCCTGDRPKPTRGARARGSDVSSAARCLKGAPQSELHVANEARYPICIGSKGFGEYLDGNVALEVRVPGTPDLAHASCTDLLDDLIGTEVTASPNRHFQFDSQIDK